ncbi:MULTISPECIES: toxin [Streptomyces]|uniref:Toxin n=1 Tax=Streptomyces lienomycini TaxID=284035 RepID=A0ABV9WJH1_9ACTN|nr:toxin [Streptomyces lienomycini]
MSSRAMRSLLSALGEEASRTLSRPADPRDVMEAFCRAMSVRKGRPVDLRFSRFPKDLADVDVSGARLDLGNRSVIVVEEDTAPLAQLVILGHELWHEEEEDRGHHIAGLHGAARTLTAEQHPEAVRRAVEQILALREVPPDAVLTVAARAESASQHEVDAETFGLLFGREVRPWTKGRYARGPVSAATVEGRINLSLLHRGGHIL